MNKAITTVLVTGATIAGVTGVLVLNPSVPSLGSAADSDEPPALSEQDRSARTSEDSEGLGEFEGLRDVDEDEDGVVPPGAGAGPRGGFAPPAFADQDEEVEQYSTDQSATDQTQQATAAGGNSYTGSTYQSPWGAMQVSITVSGGRITDIQWEQVPQSDGHSYRINSYAAPLLVDQALQAQSASVDGVSGATYTTEGFRTSLQSAIEQAGL